MIMYCETERWHETNITATKPHIHVVKLIAVTFFKKKEKKIINITTGW